MLHEGHRRVAIYYFFLVLKIDKKQLSFDESHLCLE